MTLQLSDFPVVEVDGFHAVVVRDWKNYIWEHNVARMGRPLRPECVDVWILTTTLEDANRLAKLAQRNFMPEDLGYRDRYLTAKRVPTFAAAMPSVPVDVAVYFSTSSDVDDQAQIQKLHPCPPGVNERISWSASGYLIRSGHGSFSTTVSNAPRAFAANLAKARDELLKAVGPGFDGTLPHLNASPILAGLMNDLTRPAAEAVSHWLGRLGTAELDTLVIPSKGIAGDLPVKALLFQSNGVNMHASFLLNLGGIRVTEMQVEGLDLTDTMGTALDVEARRGALMLSQIINLPGADSVPVRSLSRGYSSWTATLDPVTVSIDPPASSIPFEALDELASIEAAGNDVRADAQIVLSGLDRERASFVLYCVHDGNSGMDFDVSPWMTCGTVAQIRLRDRSYILHAEGRRTISSLLDGCA